MAEVTQAFGGCCEELEFDSELGEKCSGSKNLPLPVHREEALGRGGQTGGERVGSPRRQPGEGWWRLGGGAGAGSALEVEQND